MAVMKPAAPARTAKHVHASDLRALAQLATDATQSVTHITEGVHQAVWRTLGAPSGDKASSSRGLTGLVYKTIHGVTRGVGKAATSALARIEPLLQATDKQPAETFERAAVVAALNGVMGDRLQASDNPLSIPMRLHHAGAALDTEGIADLKGATGHVLLMVHGLCMNELQWTRQHRAHAVNHGTTLAQALGGTPLYLRYNSGLHVSQNGRALAENLETLVAHWPQALSGITVLAHSMGGLVTRSALFYARQAAMAWPQRLKHIVFLGTPHHGAPLERAGNWVDVLLGSNLYSRPFAALGQLRSAGVTDLRYGLLLDEDWQGRDRFQRRPDRRHPLPLPDDVACFTVAATLASRRSVLADRLLGDGLVPLRSALGLHDDPKRQLLFAPGRQHIAWRTGHLQLLDSPAVTAQLLQWLK